jgi:hypothetical protein
MVISHSPYSVVSLILPYNNLRVVIPAKLVLDLIGERESRLKRLDSPVSSTGQAQSSPE